MASDGNGGSFEQQVTATIQAVNDVPTGPGTNAVSVAEDGVSAAVQIGADDLDRDTLTFALKEGAEPSKGEVAFNADDGTFVYTPDPNATGEDTFTIVVSDGQGGSFEQVVTATIGAGNDDVPTIVSDGDGSAAAITVAENGTAVTTVTASDPDAGQALRGPERRLGRRGLRHRELDHGARLAS